MFKADKVFESFTDDQVEAACAFRNEVHQRFGQLMADHGLGGLVVAALQLYVVTVEVMATIALAENAVEGVLSDLHRILNICYQRAVESLGTAQTIEIGPWSF